MLERQLDTLGRFTEGGSSHASICYIWCMNPSSKDRTDLTFPSMRITGEKGTVCFVVYVIDSVYDIGVYISDQEVSFKPDSELSRASFQSTMAVVSTYNSILFHMTFTWHSF